MKTHVSLFVGVLLAALASPYASGDGLSLESVSEDGFDPNKSLNNSAETKAGLMAAILQSESELSEAQLDARVDQRHFDRATPRSNAVARPPQTRPRQETTDDIERAFGKRSAPKFVLRCWQEGRLILQRDIKSMPRLARASVQLEDGEGVSLQLFDLQNATCMMQQR
jgi:hypothetical protein